jgi:hypothetical protein
MLVRRGLLGFEVAALGMTSLTKIKRVADIASVIRRGVNLQFAEAADLSSLRFQWRDEQIERVVLAVILVVFEDWRVSPEVAGLANCELWTRGTFEADSEDRLLETHLAPDNLTCDPRGSGSRKPCLRSLVVGRRVWSRGSGTPSRDFCHGRLIRILSQRSKLSQTSQVNFSPQIGDCLQ